MKQYIKPQTQAQSIEIGQLICASSNSTIQKGDNLSGEVIPGGLYL